MRINVYSEEMTDDVELTVKEGVIGADGAPTAFAGLRFYLATPDQMHQTEHDDDRSAVTFWAHLTVDDFQRLRFRLLKAVTAVEDALVALTIPTSTATAHNATVVTVDGTGGAQ